MKEQSVEKLRKEIEKLKLQKEKELLLATTMKEKQQLMNEIAMLKKTQQKPSSFMKGLKATGKGIGFIWKNIQQASANLEKRDKGLQAVSKGNRKGAFSPEAKMWLPEITPMKGYKSKKKIKTRVKTFPKRPKTRLVTKTIYSKQIKSTSMPWELA
jgi:hypothetical protein